MKKISFLMAFLMPLSCLAACSHTPDPAPEQPTDPAESTTPEVTAEPEETVPDTGYPVDLFEIGGVAFSEFSLYVQPSAAKGITDAVSLLIEYAEKGNGAQADRSRG